MIAIQLFGQPAVLAGGRPLAISRRKSRALLFYVAARRAPTAREQLFELLWSDLSRAAAQQTLRTTLYGLRKALGPALLADDALSLSPDVDVDTWQLDDAMRGTSLGALADALARYRGDFLENFSLPDAPGFDDWAAATREHYRSLAVSGLARLARGTAAHGDYAAALEALDRALAIDPLQEDVQRDAMRVQYLAGDRVGAIRRYEQLRRRLDDELGVPPMAETRAVYDAIITDTLEVEQPRAGASPAHEPSTVALQPGLLSPAASTLPFIGRAAELQAVQALASARQLVLVEGEPGIGKTRLLEEFLRSSGALAIVGAARELDQALPYQPVVEALRALAERPTWRQVRQRLSMPQIWEAEVARLLPELARHGTAPPPSAADESRLREGLSQLLRALARQQRLVLFIDDVHWADAATLGLLGYLVRQQLSDITLVAAARPTDPRAPLAMLAQALTREGRLGRLRLARLSESDTRALAKRLSPASGAALADWLIRNGEGNPYIIAELVRHARESTILQPDGTLATQALGDESPVVPPSIYTLIASRLARLSEPARRVLDAAVAAGREFDTLVVAHAAALSDEAALDALDELAATGLVAAVDAERYAFDHTLTMEVAYKEVGEARHRLIHRRVAEALVAVHRGALDDVAGVVAMHFLESGDSARGAPYALRAARRAARLAAWTEAIGFFRQALAGLEDAQHGAVLRELGMSYERAGDYAQAGDCFREAADIARARGETAAMYDARLSLAQALISQSRFSEVIAIARQIAGSGPPAFVARAELLWGTALSLEGADLAGAAEHLLRAEQLILAARERGEETAELAHAYFELGSVLAQQGDLPGAVARYRQALASSSAQQADWYILAHNNLAYHLLLMGDSSAIGYARTGLSLAQEHGTIGFQPYLLSTLGEIALVQGDLGTAEQHFSDGLALAERLGIRERIAGLGANLGLVASRRGQAALAIHRLSTALAQADALGTRHLAAQIRIWLAPLLPPDQRRQVLDQARALAESGGRRRLLEAIDLLEQTPG